MQNLYPAKKQTTCKNVQEFMPLGRFSALLLVLDIVELAARLQHLDVER